MGRLVRQADMRQAGRPELDHWGSKTMGERGSQSFHASLRCDRSGGVCVCERRERGEPASERGDYQPAVVEEEEEEEEEE
ncbi:unnamed protein product [Pleuronectes platessa]|uniref:Uncharacterized protein n=1 Tax=Pleuronectes platessa TaxID=8262 RepID=A0A9N7TIE3_PLEPL|nr:unnamed protein product [Pleuronectes platessa]